MTRPLSVTVVVWVIITLECEAMIGVLSGLGTIVFKAINLTTLPVPILVWVTLFVAVLGLVFGAFMLRGAEWARFAYVFLKGLAIFGMLIGLFSGHTNVVIFISLVIKYAVFLYFLFRADANAYFRSNMQGARGYPDGSSEVSGQVQGQDV